MKEYQHANTKHDKLSLKNFHFRFTEESEAVSLSGYVHNAVTPFFMHDENIPIILSQDVLDLEPAYIWMGGGRLNIKMGVTVADFLRYFGKRVIVAKIQ